MKIVQPFCTGFKCSYGIFELPLYPLYNAICLWMVGCCDQVLDTQPLTQLLPHV